MSEAEALNENIDMPMFQPNNEESTNTQNDPEIIEIELLESSGSNQFQLSPRESSIAWNELEKEASNGNMNKPMLQPNNEDSIDPWEVPKDGLLNIHQASSHKETSFNHHPFGASEGSNRSFGDFSSRNSVPVAPVPAAGVRITAQKDFERYCRDPVQDRPPQSFLRYKKKPENIIYQSN